ncbi:MAG TPA: type II toxin-antitoxin system ParD family antitoxin [Tepidisphaeraceae bacterium]|jgi:antitoxin ParD1/3/4|nr:type II toxin-antitoxin system ParD family antitoxin [Tepidisphaeraceae bacterium]
MAREATLSVSLTNRLKKYVLDKVESGKFDSASEVIRHGLRTMQEQEEQERMYWSGVRKQVREARAAIEDGDLVDGPAFMKSKIASLSATPRSKPIEPRRKNRS